MILKKYKTEEPEIGDLKTVNKYAYFPKRIGDKLIWLHKYQELYEYREYETMLYRTTIMVTCHKWCLIDTKIID